MESTHVSDLFYLTVQKKPTHTHTQQIIEDFKNREKKARQQGCKHTLPQKSHISCNSTHKPRQKTGKTEAPVGAGIICFLLSLSGNLNSSFDLLLKISISLSSSWCLAVCVQCRVCILCYLSVCSCCCSGVEPCFTCSAHCRIRQRMQFSL